MTAFVHVVLAVEAVLILAGIGWAAWLLGVQRGTLWRPGDPLPPIPDDAAGSRLDHGQITPRSREPV